MNYISLIICLLLAITPSMSQNLKFENSIWDFSTITEEGGDVSHTFTFVNVTSSPIVIINATTTCGCTIPKYSRKPILPGVESTIEITYDPMYRPGRFSREVKIYTSASDSPEVIKIVGDVTPRKKSLQEQYIYLLEKGVRISSLYAYLQNVSPLSPRSSAFEVINTSDESVKLEIRNPSSNSFLIADAPQTLAAGESQTVNVSYILPEEPIYYGELIDSLDIYIDGQRSKMAIQTRAYAIEDFGAESKKGNARAEFSKKMIIFEPFNIAKGSVKKSITIENIGTAPLFIRGIDAPQGVKIVSIKGGSPIGADIQAGKSLEICVLIEPSTEADMLGDFAKHIIFILNDPEEPVVRVRVVGSGEN